MKDDPDRIIDLADFQGHFRPCIREILSVMESALSERVQNVYFRAKDLGKIYDDLERMRLPIRNLTFHGRKVRQLCRMN